MCSDFYSSVLDILNEHESTLDVSSSLSNGPRSKISKISTMEHPPWGPGDPIPIHSLTRRNEECEWTTFWCGVTHPSGIPPATLACSDRQGCKEKVRLAPSQGALSHSHSIFTIVQGTPWFNKILLIWECQCHLGLIVRSDTFRDRQVAIHDWM